MAVNVNTTDAKVLPTGSGGTTPNLQDEERFILQVQRFMVTGRLLCCALWSVGGNHGDFSQRQIDWQSSCRARRSCRAAWGAAMLAMMPGLTSF